MRAFEPYLDDKNRITENKFCEVMSKIDRYIRHDNYKRFVEKIFKRHDKDKDNLLNREGKRYSAGLSSCRIYYFDEELQRPKS